MTEQEQQEAQATAQQEAFRQAQQAQFEQAQRAHAEWARQQQEAHAEAILAQRRAAETQQLLNTLPRQKYACIVAVDERGGFGKDGKIPWNYPEDFKWFQNHTKGQICVMGRTTYEDIVNHLGSKSDVSVLPGRKCFVVTSKPLEKNNATAVASISDVDKHLTEDDITKTVFFCGGERIYSEGIAKCDQLFITVVNKDAECDRFFPVNYVLKHFHQDKTFQVDSASDLRFTIWKRK